MAGRVSLSRAHSETGDARFGLGRHHGVALTSGKKPAITIQVMHHRRESTNERRGGRLEDN